MPFDWLSQGNVLKFPAIISALGGGVHIVNQCHTCGKVWFITLYTQNETVELSNYCVNHREVVEEPKDEH